MKVKDLIAVLMRFDGDAEVIKCECTEDYNEYDYHDDIEPYLFKDIGCEDHKQYYRKKFNLHDDDVVI